jgi:putative copper export protein
MLPVTETTVRLFLHVLAATIWVGGQLTLGAVIPALRPAADDPDPEAARARIRAVARRFQVVAWVAFGILLVTGVWNLMALHVSDQSGPWLATLLVKLGCVAASGLAAALHIVVAAPRVRVARAETDRRKAAALSGMLEGASVLFAVAALLLGVLLTSG